MAMPASAHVWRPEEARSLPDDGKRYEVIDGALVVTPAPSWTHQAALAELFVRLRAYVIEHRIGRVIFAPADVEIDQSSLVQPDLFVVPLVGGRQPRDWSDVRELLLVVEVISPSSARTDRQLKRKFYQRAEVPEYWLVDIDARLIERWRPSDDRPEMNDDRIEWRPDAGCPALVIDMAEYFAAVEPS
ncbi:MAG: Uma2 family endonuclease [Pseudomonadota bacterium]